MDDYNHEVITEGALEHAGLADDALAFIVRANKDSDKWSGGYTFSVQHFQPADRGQSTQQVISNSRDFYRDLLCPLPHLFSQN